MPPPPRLSGSVWESKTTLNRPSRSLTGGRHFHGFLDAPSSNHTRTPAAFSRSASRRIRGLSTWLWLRKTSY